jgi:hypothetical protein
VFVAANEEIEARFPLSRPGEPRRFPAFVFVEKSDELTALRLFLCSNFQNKILRYQIGRIAKLDQFLVLIDRLFLGAALERGVETQIAHDRKELILR